MFQTNSYGEVKGVTPKGKRIFWLVAGVVVLIGLFFLSYRQVDNGHIGIVKQGGKVVDTREPGRTFILPWPIQSMEQMNTKIQREEADAAAASKELQEVRATLVLNYSLTPDKALEVYRTIGTNFREVIIDSALQETFKATTAQFSNTQLIEQRAMVKQRALDALRLRLATYGVTTHDLNIVNFAFSPEFTKAIEESRIAEQKVLQAEANARTAAADAKGRYDAAVLDAKAQQVQRETLSDALLRLRWIEKWDGRLPTYTGGDSTPLIQIPAP